MGIPRFYKYIFDSYPECVRRFEKSAASDRFDYLCIDMNVVLHAALNSVDVTSIRNPSLRDSIRETGQVSAEYLYTTAWLTVCALVKTATPRKAVFIAIDGIPGMSKMAQQRKRRYTTGAASSQNQPGSELFERSKISSGTRFMRGFCEYLKTTLENEAATFECGFSVSDDTEPGEGEHKIIQFIKRIQHIEPSASFVLYSIDTDVILLLLGVADSSASASVRPKLYFLREALYRFIKEKYLLMDISCLYDAMLQRVPPQLQAGFMTDFIFIMSFIGNDFVPNTPALELQQGAVQHMLRAYYQLDTPICVRLQTSGDHPPESRLRLNAKSLRRFLGGELCESEPSLLRSKKNQYSWTRDFSDHSLGIDAYYATKLNGVARYTVCYAYLKMFAFIIKYYLEGIPSWTHFYPFHYAPLIKDMCDFLDAADAADIESMQTFNMDEPISVRNQLCMILPVSKHYIIREVYPDFKMSPHVECYYPSQYEVDSDGRDEEYEYIVKLPFIEPHTEME